MVTKAGLEQMFNGRQANCIIKGRCYTSVFRFPKGFLREKSRIDPLPIIEREQSRVTMVSDLRSYFQEHSPFRHYSIDFSLRHKVEESIQKETGNFQNNVFPLFVVIEQKVQYEKVLDDMSCFAVDEKYFSGARDAVVTCKTSDGAWPEEKDANEFINMVLAAIKIEQETTDYIKEIFGVSCFFDVDGQSVHIIPEMIGNFELRGDPPISDEELRAKAGRLQKLVTGFDVDISNDGGKNKKKTSRLITALRLEETKDDYYRRIWCLRLYEAVINKLSGGPKKEFQHKHKKHQAEIRHPDVCGEISKEYFNSLQTDVLAALRRIYLGRP